MKEFLEKLRQQVAENPPNYGDADSVLGLLFQSVILVGWYTLLRMQNTFLQSRKKHESQSMRENSSNNMIIVFDPFHPALVHQLTV